MVMTTSNLDSLIRPHTRLCAGFFMRVGTTPILQLPIAIPFRFRVNQR